MFFIHLVNVFINLQTQAAAPPDPCY